VTGEPSTVILDTSVFIATETGRSVGGLDPSTTVSISVVTLAELKAGVLAATQVKTRSIRLNTLGLAQSLTCLPIDEFVADIWSALRVEVARLGRRVNINDLWIAATALRHESAVATQDGDFDIIADVSELQVVQV